MKIEKQSSCQYYYGTDDASLWWDKPYYEALAIKKSLTQGILDEICSQHYLTRDAERMNRLLKVIKDIEKQQKDEPK